MRRKQEEMKNSILAQVLDQEARSRCKKHKCSNKISVDTDWRASTYLMYSMYTVFKNVVSNFLK